MLQGGDTSSSIGFSNTVMTQYFKVAYPELWQIMAQVQTPRVRREFYHYLPAFTTYFDPQAIGVTDFAEPELIEERGSVTLVGVSTTSTATPIRVTTSVPHGLTTDSFPVQVAGVSGSTAPWGYWYFTVTGITAGFLNGSSSDGNAGTGGNMMWSSEPFRPMGWTRDPLLNAQISNYLGTCQWQDNALKFIGATQPIQIHVTYWASGNPPTNVNTEIGIDDCMAFLSTRVASLAARSRGWYQMASELKRDALGPSGMADGSGGLLRTWLNLQVQNIQRTVFVKPPFRSSNLLEYPGDYIYGSMVFGGSGGAAPPPVSPNPQGYYIVPVTGGNALLDLSLGNIQVVNLLVASTNVGTPANRQPGPFWVKVIQDATGGRSVTFSADYLDVDPTAFSGPGTPANSVTILIFAVQDDLEISYLGLQYGPTPV